MSTRIRGYGLEDLIAGITPDLSGWTNDPTDASRTTNGEYNVTTTGSKILTAGYQYAYMEFDLKSKYIMLISALGEVLTTAGSGRLYVEVYNNDGGGWDKGQPTLLVSGYGDNPPTAPVYGYGEKVRFGFTASEAATINPRVLNLSCLKIGKLL